MQFYCIGGVRKPVSIWCDHHLLRIELIRLLIVACGMLVHSSSMAVRSCWILVGTGTRCRIRRSRASQTCSMGDMSGEYAGHARTGMFSASRNCVQILTFTFTFNHLADAFIQSDIQMRRTIEAIRPSREQQYTSAMTSLS